MLKIIDRYLLREFLLYLLLGLSTFIGIYLVVDLFEKIDVFVDHEAPVHLVLIYYLYSLPLILVQVLPVAMLLGAILAFGHLRKFNEITAMQAGGLSPLRITIPLLICALVITCVSYVVAEEIMPGAFNRKEETLDVRIKKQRPIGSRGRSGIYYMGRGGRVWVAERFVPQPPSLRTVSVQHFRSSAAKQQMWKRVDAQSARWEAGIWSMRRGVARIFEGAREVAVSFNEYGDSRYVEQPDEFARPESDPLNMNRRQLKDYIRRIRESGAEYMQYEVNYHIRAAFPLANFIMVLLGSCLSLRVVRGTLALGFGISISLGFAYYGFLRVGQALGYNGTVPPLLAAWLGNLAFLAVGGLLFWRMNR
jgi:lipopolysaccharide export system permease protein